MSSRKKSAEPPDAPRGTSAKDPQDADAVPAPPPAEDLRKKELIARVMDRAELKQGVAREAVEATLEILGEALAEGRALNLPPLGRVKVQRRRQTKKGQVMLTRVKRAHHDPHRRPDDDASDVEDDAEEGLAQPVEAV
ncbi:HU family DNA-binding protein [Roseivivax isoporae]|uniref:HU family DNA-binding protein n=1 Tax=Roseivivax isoporae TaxID=591206 RepID=UPI00138E539A|nr:HU family DNA-binding protein [Roseivivax isoporae]